MTAWWSGNAVLFDTETDGVAAEDTRIITACVAEVGGGLAPSVRTWLAQTERPIPAEASAIHGVSTERADREGEAREIVMAEVAARICLARGNVPLVGHNLRFDLTILDREMRRLGIGSLGHEHGQVTVRIDGRRVGAFHVIDTLCLDKAVDPYRRGRRTLDTTAAHYGVPVKGTAHTAEADALAAGRVAWAIARRCGMPINRVADLYLDRRDPYEVAGRFYDLGEVALPDLHRMQVVWAAEQARGLAGYFTKKGDHEAAASVSLHWPLEPVRTETVTSDLV